MDETLLLWINQGWAQPWLDPFFIWVSERATFSLPMLAIILIIWLRKFHKDGLKLWLILLIVIGAGDNLGKVIKHSTSQARPCFELHEIVRQPSRPDAGPCGDNLEGMPSNHALNFFATASFIGFTLRRRRWTASMYAIAVLVGISRIYLGKHYPGQVLVGAILGIALGYLCAWLSVRYLPFMQRITPR